MLIQNSDCKKSHISYVSNMNSQSMQIIQVV